MSDIGPIDAILLPTDLSDLGRAAAGHALALAEAHRVPLYLVHVVEVPSGLRAAASDGGWLDEVRAERLAALDAFAAALRTDTGPEVRAVVRVGDTATEILELTSCGAPVVVMGTHGGSGFRRFLLGSVTVRLLPRLPAPALLVPGAPVGVALARALLGCDLGDGGPDAVDGALRVLRPVLKTLEVATVDAAPSLLALARGEVRRRLASELQDRDAAIGGILERLRARGEAAGVPTSAVRIESDRASDGLCEHAAAGDFDLIVVASHGRTGFAHALLGSVADEVVRQSTRPVLVLKPPPLQ